jgi:hypothetical protein
LHVAVSRRPPGAHISITSILVNEDDTFLHNNFDDEAEIVIISKTTLAENKRPTQIARMAILINDEDILMINGVIVPKTIP